MGSSFIYEAKYDQDVIRSLKVGLEDGVACDVILTYKDKDGNTLGVYKDETYVENRAIKYPFNIKEIAESLKINEEDVDHLIAAVDIDHDGEIAKGEECKLKILPSKNCQITVDFLNELIGNSNNWFMGKGSKNIVYQQEYSRYTNIHNFDKHKFIEILKQKMKEYNIDKSCYHIAHFLSQVIHESAHFDTTLEYGNGYNYEPGIHSNAIKNGNIDKGDGSKYRGRGLLQLTWKNNYKAYSKARNIDFVSNPEAIGNNMYNAIDVSCWYWRNRGAIYKKYGAKGDINILIDNDKYNVRLITLAVNGGNNGLEDRKNIFMKILKKWRLQ